MKVEIDIPDKLVPPTMLLVKTFAEALAVKLEKAQTKYGYGSEWMEPNWRTECLDALTDHLMKGDPRDVAIYCAFAWFHKWKLSYELYSYIKTKPETMVSHD